MGRHSGDPHRKAQLTHREGKQQIGHPIEHNPCHSEGLEERAHRDGLHHRCKVLFGRKRRFGRRSFGQTMLGSFVAVWKITELDKAHHQLAARLCALGDNLRDAQNVKDSGIDDGEILFCLPPILSQSRLFRIC